MAKSSKRLLVEGNNDRLFFEACCTRCQLSDVQIGPPMDMGARQNGKNNAIALLPQLIDQLEQQTVTHLALVVDADAKETSGLGFVGTWERVTRILAEKDFMIPTRPTKPGTGFHFKHNNGLPPVGLWVMPDNMSNGFLEDFVQKSLVGKEKTLLQHAQCVVGDLKEPKFASHHKSKAEVATLMAWQKMPGQGMHGAVGAELLDFDKGLAKDFLTWLKAAFGK